MSALDELIAQLKLIKEEIEIKSSLDSEMEVNKLENKIIELHFNILKISRDLHNIPFILSKEGKKFQKIDRAKILNDMSTEVDQIINRFDPVDSQLVCNNLFFVFHQPEAFAVKTYNYVLNEKINFKVFCKISFPSYFGYFSTLEFCCNAASMILKFISICKNKQYIFQLAETFLQSQYSFYEALWTRFIKKIKRYRTSDMMTRANIYKALVKSLNDVILLIEVPFHQIIIEILKINPISSSISFLLKTIIYKTGKLFLRYHSLCKDFKFKQSVLMVLKEYTQNPCPIEANQIVKILSDENASIFNLPSLIDEGHLIHLPLIFSDYEAIEYCKIVVSPKIFKNSFLNSKNENEIKKMLFLPFQVQLFSNKQHFRRKKNDFFITPYQLFPLNKYFTEEQISTLDFQWQQENIFKKHFPEKSKEYELYFLYKTIEEMNQKIDQMNHAIILFGQYQLMEKRYNILEIYHNLVLTRFCEKTKPFQIFKMEPQEYCIKCLKIIKNLNYKSIKLKFPFLVNMLNQISIDSIIDNRITSKFQEILDNLSNINNVFINSYENIKQRPFLILSLTFEYEVKLGDRFQILMDYIDSIQKVASHYKIDDICGFHKSLIASSQNQYILETVLLIEKFIFQNKDFTNEIDIELRKRWFTFFQSILIILTEDSDFVSKCSSIIL